MRRPVAALLVIAWLRQPAFADADNPVPAPPDPSGAVTASGATPPAPQPDAPTPAATTPWIDLAPAPVLDHTDDDGQPKRDHKTAAALTLAGFYVAFTGWTYIAWYRKHKPLAEYKFGGDGWLGDRTYAGGADKFGHAWATMSLARMGTEILNQWGGYSRLGSALVATALSEALFAGVEVKDGFYYEFSFSDLAGDTTGAVLAFALSMWPRLDELFDYRVQYFPSQMYIRKLTGASPCPTGSCSKYNIAEDYSGETYLLAFHLGGIHALRDLECGSFHCGTLARFIDLTASFDTRNYKPNPDPQFGYAPHQQMALGISFNAQGFFDWLLEDRPSRASHHARKITHALGEVFNLPFSSVRLIKHDDTPTGPITRDGA